MPRGPQGQKRPTDVVGRAMHVAKIATGEIKETLEEKPKRQPGRKRSGKARAAALTPERRSEIAGAVAARWGKND